MTDLPDLPERWQGITDPGVYDRGVNYFLQNKVQEIDTPSAAHERYFIVQGSAQYDVMLDLQQPLRSYCDCPHAESVAVCKHMVAAWMSAHAGAPPAILRTAAGKTAKASARLQEMQANVDFLQSRSAEQLSQWIGEQCDRDPQLAKQLSLWRTSTLNSPQTPAQWRKYLTQAMPQRRDLYGRELQRWATDAQQALQPLAQQLPLQPGNIRAAATIALMRLYKLWETADDSQGQLHDLHDWLRDLLLQSLSAEAPPASWLKDWMALMQADPMGDWNEQGILTLGGTALQQAYYQQAIAAWQQWCQDHPGSTIKPRRGYVSDDWMRSRERSTLRKRYLLAMKASLDTPGLILLMQQTAQSESDWTEAVAFCEAQNHPREAMACVQMSLQAHPDHLGLQTQLLHCYQRDGWDEEALALAQKLLRQRPDDLKRLDAVLQCAAALGQSKETALQAEVAYALTRKSLNIHGKKCTDISAPVHWLLREDQWQQALALLDQAQVFCDSSTRRKLALHLPAGQHPRAVQLLQEILEQNMPSAYSPYQEELQLVRLIWARLPPEAVTTWLDDLRQRFQRKVNFIKGLAALS